MVKIIWLLILFGFLAPCCGQTKNIGQMKAHPVAGPSGNIITGIARVTDFGAVGDGVTDDTRAVQTAINSGAGAVYFPTTVHGYKIGKLVIRSAINIYGDNKQSTLITPAASSITLFTVSSNFVTIENLYFVSFKGGMVKDTAIQFQGSINTVVNCFFSGMKVGIYNNATYATNEQFIKNCRFRDCDYGILSDGYFRNSRISDYCAFHTCKCAISLYDNNDNVHTTEGVVIENIIVYDCGDQDLGLGAVNIKNCDFTTIRNCNLDLNRYIALKIAESKWCDFSGSYFSSNHSKNASAVSVAGDCSDLFFLNCRFFDSHSWGLELQGMKRNPSNITVSNCSFRLNPQGDIIVNGVNNVQISRSNFYSDVPTSVSAISDDGKTVLTVTNSFIKGKIYHGSGAVEVNLK